MTSTLTSRYRQRVPYGTPLWGTAEHARSEGRKTLAEGHIALPDGTPLVEATGLFITRLDPSSVIGSQSTLLGDEKSNPM